MGRLNGAGEQGGAGATRAPILERRWLEGALDSAGAATGKGHRASARLFLAGAFIYAIYPLLVLRTDGLLGTGHDPATVAMAAGLALGAAALRFGARWIPRPEELKGVVTYLVSLHVLYIAWDRQLDAVPVLAVLLVMATVLTSLPFTLPGRGVLLGYAAVMSTGTVLVGLTVTEPVLSPLILICTAIPLLVVALISQTAWLRVIERARAAERSRRTVVRNAPIALLAVDPEGRVLLAEGKGLLRLGLEPDDLPGRRFVEGDPAVPEVLRPALARDLREPFGQTVQVGERTFEATYEPLRERDAEGIVVVVYDVTERTRAEAALAERERRALHDALHDPLTGLPNRALLHDRVTQALRRLQRHPEEHFALLHMDLDRFKGINEGLGHEVGDELLELLALRLRECLRPSDTLARLGGDEFALLLEDVREVGEVHRIAGRVQDTLQAPIHLHGHEVVISASSGIAMSRQQYRLSQELLRDAEIAMNRAKKRGGGRFVLFDLAMHEEAMALLRLEADLRGSIGRGDFALHYQPLVELGSRCLCGFEALVRWRHPSRGLLPPSAFIPMAEENGLIVPIGMEILEEACETIRTMKSDRSAGEPLHMSINVSPRQLVEPDMVHRVRQVLERSGVDPAWLVFEVTESALVEELDRVRPVVEALRDLGVGIAIDDFGTGYNSLAYLQRLPFDRIKIDRSFIAEMHAGREQLALVKTIISLARGLGLGVVAEGVETLEQAEALADLGVDIGQGYHFGRPTPLEEALDRARGGPSAPATPAGSTPTG